MLSADELYINQPSVPALPDEVIFYINVLTPVVMNRVLHQCDGGFVVHHELRCTNSTSDQLCQQTC